MAEKAPVDRAMSGLQGIYVSKILDAFHLYIALCLSQELVNNVVVGGALCLLGQVLVVFIRLLSKRNSALLPRNIQGLGIIIFLATSLLSAVLLLVVYPTMAQSGQFLLLLYCVIVLTLKQGITAVLAGWLQVKMVWRVMALLVAHMAFGIALAVLLAPWLDAAAFHDVITMLAATSLATAAYQIFAIVPREQRPQNAKAANVDQLFKISAYRVYNRMVSNSFSALNLALLAYICYMQFEPQHTMLERFWNLVIWLLLVGSITWFVFQFLKKSITKYDKPSVFIVGALMIVLAIIGTYRSWFAGIWMILGYMLWGVGLACMFSIIISLGADMQAVLELDMPEEETAGYRFNTFALVELSLTLSTFLLLLMLTGITFVAEGKLGALIDIAVVRVSMRSLLFIPPVLVLSSMLYALMQPLNKDYAKKLAHYRAQQRLGNVNPALATRLQFMLVQETRRIAPRVICTFLRPLVPCRVVGKERVDVENGPVIFVCNHLEVYGPIITKLYLPFYFRSWIIADILDKDTVARQLEGGVNEVFKWVPKKVRAKMPGWIAPIALYVLNALDPIPVYRGNMREVLKTIKLTVEAMEYEDNILLFPENPESDEGRYKITGISDFFSGFASIASEYYKKTKQCTTFYPMYADKIQKTLTIGEGVRYNPENERNTEKERIVNTLHDWMSEQAERAAAQS